MILYIIVIKLLFVLSKILFRLEISGRENIPGKNGFILASNHSSFLDPPVLAASCPRQLSSMARHDLFTVPIFGAFIRALGSFPIRRGSSDVRSLKEGLRILGQGRALLVFPEGIRSYDELIKKPEAGIAFLAAKSGVAVIPAFVKGAKRAFGRGAHFIRPTKIKVSFGKPIYANNITKHNYHDFANKVMQAINALN